MFARPNTNLFQTQICTYLARPQHNVDWTSIYNLDDWLLLAEVSLCCDGYRFAFCRMGGGTRGGKNRETLGIKIKSMSVVSVTIMFAGNQVGCATSKCKPKMATAPFPSRLLVVQVGAFAVVRGAHTASITRCPIIPRAMTASIIVINRLKRSLPGLTVGDWSFVAPEGFSTRFIGSVEAFLLVFQRWILNGSVTAFWKWCEGSAGPEACIKVSHRPAFLDNSFRPVL